MGLSWTCPTCAAHTTITEPNIAESYVDIRAERTNKDQCIRLSYQLIECPNQDCKAQSFQVHVWHGTWGINHDARKFEVLHQRDRPVGIGSFTFLPTTSQPLSVHAPKSVSADYNEAYLIAQLSPKASATLARRALQGMIRDFFAVQGKRTLHQELEAVKDQCDPELFDAMMAVKSVGNIGAHPEHDASLIVDVEPGEADTLLQLIHLLDREWYVARAERAARIAKMKSLGDAKSAAKAPGAVMAMLGASVPRPPTA